MLSFDSSRQTLRFSPVHGPEVTWRLALEADGRELDAAAAEVRFDAGPPWVLTLRFAAPALTWTIRADVDAAGGLVSLCSTLENRGSAAVALGRVWPLPAAPLPLGAPTV